MRNLGDAAIDIDIRNRLERSGDAESRARVGVLKVEKERAALQLEELLEIKRRVDIKEESTRVDFSRASGKGIRPFTYEETRNALCEIKLAVERGTKRHWSYWVIFVVTLATLILTALQVWPRLNPFR